MFDLVQHGAVAVLTLCRPPVNAISSAWIAGFHELLDELEERDDWSVLHIRSDQRVFCAGADLEQMRGRLELPDAAEILAEETRAFQILFARIEALPRVVLAEIGGAAMGGGFELTLACDLRMAAHEAKLGLPEGRLGLLPAAGGTQRLTRLCGAGTAARIILACEIVDGTTALDLGMVQWAVPFADLEAEALALSERIAALPRTSIEAGKSCIAAVRQKSRDGFAEEVEATRALFATAETKERVTAFFEDRSQKQTAGAR